MDPNTENTNLSDLASEEVQETDSTRVAPQEEVPTRPNYYEANSEYLRGLRESISAEIRAADRSNQALVALLQDVQTCLDVISTMAMTRVRGDGFETIPVQNMLHDYFSIINTILSGGIMTPLAGTEDEWEDVQIDPSSDRKMVVPFRGQDCTIEFKSVQVNKRFPKVYRFNKDNRLAHRIDLVRLEDPNRPGAYYTSNVSRRFIKFPYTLETVTKQVTMSEDAKSVVAYADGTDLDVLDQIVFKIGDKVLLAPPVPVYMLKKMGIDIDAELAKA